MVQRGSRRTSAPWCAPAHRSGSPAFVRGGGSGGWPIYAAYAPPPGFDASLTSIRSVSSSGGTVHDQAADTSDRHPLACEFTAVFADKTCRLIATGERSAERQVVQSSPVSTGPLEASPESSWSLRVHLVDADRCLEHRSLGDTKVAVLVEGDRPELRVVRFETVVSFAGRDGSVGPSLGPDGTSLNPEIARWPAEERARYGGGAGFEALRTRSGDLYWFTSLRDTNSPWSSRLRDGRGSHLRLSFVADGIEHERTERVVLVAAGARLYWEGGQLR
jgi:hypothetical protein